MVTRSGWSKLTNAYQSVMSAVRSRAVIGASRWLEASRLPGSSAISVNNANIGRNRFGCMDVPLEGDFREYRIVGSTQGGRDWIASIQVNSAHMTFVLPTRSRLSTISDQICVD